MVNFSGESYTTGGYITPATNEDFESFRNYIDRHTGKPGKPNYKALGVFAYRLSKNPDVNVQYRRNEDGDYFAVFPERDPGRVTVVKTDEKYEPEWQTQIDNDIKKFVRNHPELKDKSNFVQNLMLTPLCLKKAWLTFRHAGILDALPDAMRKTIDVAKEMQENINWNIPF